MADAKVRKTVKVASRLKFALVGLLVGLVIGVGGMLVVQNMGSSSKDAHVQPSVVFDRIVQKSELVSASQTYNITDKVSDVGTFFDLFDLPFTENSFWYRYVGTIKAGVDLEEAAFLRQGRTITVTLSQPYIVSNTPDMEASGVLEEANNIFNPIHVEDVDAFQRMCVEQSEEQVLNGGLMDDARANAEQDIRDMFTAALGDAYTIEFEWREAAEGEQG